jgi:O-antigen ligase
MDRIAFTSVWLFVFFIPLEDMLFIPGVGALGRILGLVSLAVGIFALVVTKTEIRVHRLHILVSLFVYWAALSMFWTLDQEYTKERIWTYTQLLVMIGLIFQWVYTEQRLRILLKAYVLGASVAAIATVLNFLDAAEKMQRFALQGFNPNNLAVILALGIPLGWYVFLTEDSRLRGWPYGLYALLAPIAVILTASRNGMIATILALSFVVLSIPFNRWHHRLTLTATAGAAFFLAIYLVPSWTWNRLASTTEEIGGMNGRFNIWAAGAEAFFQHPLVGVGAGTFKVAVENSLGVLIAPHNVYVAVLVEMGLIGFFLFILIIGSILNEVWKMRGLSRLLWLNIFMVWGISAAALNWEWRKQTWLMFVLAATHAAITYKSQTGKVPSEELPESAFTSQQSCPPLERRGET